MAPTKVLKTDWVEGECAYYLYLNAPSMLPGDTIKPRLRDGQAVVVLTTFIEPDSTHDEEVLPMFLVRFPDGYECELWPEEMVGA